VPELTNTPKPTSRPTATAIPVSYEVESPDYSVQLTQSQSPGVSLNLFLDEAPLVDEGIQILSLQENVVGDLYCDDWIDSYKTDINGEVKIEGLPPGLYAAFLTTRAVSVGFYGVHFPDERNCPANNTSHGESYGFVFPVQSDKDTHIDVQFTNLEVGLIFEGEAYYDGAVEIKQDSPFIDKIWARTKKNGIADFTLGAGNYELCVRVWASLHDDICSNLSIPPGTTYIRKVIDMPEKPGR
jgi:hypothetical protein